MFKVNAVLVPFALCAISDYVLVISLVFVVVNMVFVVVLVVLSYRPSESGLQ
jgi:hypothetical protein